MARSTCMQDVTAQSPAAAGFGSGFMSSMELASSAGRLLGVNAQKAAIPKSGL
jgi:hypothetical protein